MPLILPKQDPAGWQTVADKITIGINAAGQLCLKDEDGNVTPILSSAPSDQFVTNDGSEDTEIDPTQPVHSAVVTITGAARVVNIILPPSAQSSGALCSVNVTWPALDGYVIRFYNTEASGSPIASFTTAADGPTTGLWNFLRGASLWSPKSAQVPAY